MYQWDPEKKPTLLGASKPFGEKTPKVRHLNHGKKRGGPGGGGLVDRAKVRRNPEGRKRYGEWRSCPVYIDSIRSPFTRGGGLLGGAFDLATLLFQSRIELKDKFR